MPARSSYLRRLSLIIALLTALLLGWYLGYQGYGLSFSWGKVQVINREPPSGTETDLDLSLFWRVLGLLENKYYDPSRLRGTDLLYGAVSGLVGSLNDPYTVFFTPEENKEFKQSLAGTYEGVGAQLGFLDHQLVIVAPLKNSPAERQGVKAGDAILEVDGVSTQGWSLAKAVASIRGEKGSEVNLKLGRQQGEDGVVQINLTIKREEIKIPCVALEWPENKIAHLTLYRFGEDLQAEWAKAVSRIQEKGAEGLVLDVRNNPGGYLNGALIVGSEFFSEGNIVLKRAAGKTQEMGLDHKGKLTNIPLVVLVNEGSASASEIVAGAIQIRKRGMLVGGQTFGKGTVQEALDLDGGAGLHITVSDWLLPNGESIDGKGLLPDVEVELTDEDVSRGEDPQLKKAIELLK